MEKIKINSLDGYELNVHVFEVKKATAVVQIVHGMEEHQERYEPFIEYLNKNGFSVVSSDMRGHGTEAKNLGYFKDKNGYKDLIADQVAVTQFVKSRFEGLPVYIFAHSMGTIITRVLLQQHSKDYEKVVLSGYPNYQAATPMGIFVADTIKAFRGAKYKSKFVNNLSVGAFNKKIKNPRTPVDWVCSNEETVDNYINDPLCGFGFTVSAFGDLFRLVKLMHKPKLYKNVNIDMPILMLRGSDDPCTGGEKGAADSREILKRAGFKNISFVDYEGMRHEILNETEKEKVYADALKFFKS